MKKKRNPNIIFFSVNGLNTVVNMLMEKLADLYPEVNGKIWRKVD